VASDEQQRLWERWDQDDAPFDTYVGAIRDLCIRSLRTLDDEGLFLADRASLTLMILSRDEVEDDDELLGIVGALNPPAVVERYRTQRASTDP
jgi:hypothetical protein